MNIITSNRMEFLFARLVSVLQESLPSPLDKEWFVVSGRGMQRWLNLQLAEQFGIWANAEFMTPLESMETLFEQLLPGVESGDTFDVEVMTWALLRRLQTKGDDERFVSIQPYLQDDNPELKLYFLARRLAESFDRYTIYRPHLIEEWQSGQEPNDWQAILWRELVEEYGPKHRVERRKKALESLTFGEKKGLPRRLFVFGISRLPPFFLDFYQALSQVFPVHLFVLNPCREYWGDVVGEKERIRRTLKAGEGWTPEDLYLEVGNSLLASMGRHSQEFLELLLEVGQFDDEFITPPTTSVLGQIQHDILHLHERKPEEDEPPRPIEHNDDSLQLHVCHSPMRELEVLYDQLLQRFDRDPTLSPRDVLVMAPDIQVYAPLIQSVFQPADHEKDAVSIPFSIAEQRKRVEQELCEAFVALLQFTNSRYGLVQVLELLEVEAVHRRFGMDEEDVMQVRYWLEDVRIRWGRDEQHRDELGMPRFRENTWMAGLDRLMLGYAMPGDDVTLFNGILPYDPIEGESTLLLGRLVDFTQALFGYTRACEKPRTLAEWSEFLLSLVETFFHEDDTTERSLQFIRERLHELRESSTLAKFEHEINVDVLLSWLQEAFAETRNPAAFLTGSVTFANLLPLRGIPARIVCVLGLNDADFPRMETLPGFDRVRQKPMRGDHSTRFDDRYKFLEALLSARETLLLSYAGQDIHDNSELAPSVVLSELRDYLQKNFVALDDYGMMTGDPLRHVEFVHPLHPFNPLYFSEGGRFFSYSRANHRAAQVLRQHRVTSQPLLPSRFTVPQL